MGSHLPRPTRVNLAKISDLFKWISRVNLVNWLRASGGYHSLGPAKNIKFNERSSEFPAPSR